MRGFLKKLFIAALLIVLFPVFLLLALLILITNGAPVLFTQKRVGKHKSTFNLYKFRTMKDGEAFLLGKILRKTGLDELPQLWNILQGTMNFIGPRPLTQDDITRLNWESKYYSKRWDVKPGLTGLSQLSPVCHKKMTWALDKHYLKNKSAILDLKIVSLSLIVPIFGKNAAKSLMRKK